MASIRKWAQNKNNLKLNSSNGKFGIMVLARIKVKDT
jgi:hypothetical protein